MKRDCSKWSFFVGVKIGFYHFVLIKLRFKPISIKKMTLKKCRFLSLVTYVSTCPVFCFISIFQIKLISTLHHCSWHKSSWAKVIFLQSGWHSFITINTVYIWIYYCCWNKACTSCQDKTCRHNNHCKFFKPEISSS